MCSKTSLQIICRIFREKDKNLVNSSFAQKYLILQLYLIEEHGYFIPDSQRYTLHLELTKNYKLLTVISLYISAAENEEK